MKGVTIAGNCLADIIKRIEEYPAKGMLAKITQVSPGVGGCVPNTGITLKALDPAVRVCARARVGKDANGAYVCGEMERRGIDISGVAEDAALSTAFTDVYSLPGGERTFFTYAGANAAFCEEDALPEEDCGLFHLGYLLLLETLDAPDAEYGTRAARLLARVRERGVKTSIDMVSAAGARFRAVALPALRYCDYAVMNEIEAGSIAGIPLREGDRLCFSRLREACEALLSAGVKDTVVIHCPECGCAMDAAGRFTAVPSLALPKGYIVGSVGAGDAFCAGMLYAFLQGMPAEEGLRLASAVAACNLSAADSVGGARPLADTLALEKKFERRALPL